jgi:hypothetical protein
MGLQEQQNLLAKLYVDPDFRIAFMADPVAIGSAVGLTENESAEIAAVSADEIELFADSLYWKRLHEVEKLLPITARVLGVEFRNHFRIFAAGVNHRSIRKHLDDAIEFCRFLSQIPEIMPVVRDAAKFERAKLEFFGRNRRLAFVVLRHEMKAPYARRLSMTVWLRFRGAVHCFGG